MNKNNNNDSVEGIEEDDILEVIEDDDQDREFEEDGDNEGDDGNEEEMKDRRDDAIAYLEEHSEAVLCCDISKDDKFAVSGGQDDKALVWDVATRVSTPLTGFTDSVVAVKFNVSSTRLACGDMAGLIKVYETGTWAEKFSFDVGDLNWLLWHPVAENVLLAGTESGEAWMWKLSEGNEQSKIYPSMGHSNSVAKIFDDGKRIAMGYADGTVHVFDLKEGTVLHSLTGNQAHTGNVLSLDLNSDNTLLASGSVDSTIKIISTNNFKVLFSIDCTPKEQEESETTNSIESLVFCGKNLLVIGGLDGTLEVWDVSGKIKRGEARLDCGVVKILADKNDVNQVFVCALEEVYLVDIRNCSVIESRTGHSSNLLDFAISSDSQFVVTCSEDATLGVFSFEKE